MNEPVKDPGSSLFLVHILDELQVRIARDGAIMSTLRKRRTVPLVKTPKRTIPFQIARIREAIHQPINYVLAELTWVEGLTIRTALELLERDDLSSHYVDLVPERHCETLATVVGDLRL